MIEVIMKHDMVKKAESDYYYRPDGTFVGLSCDTKCGACGTKNRGPECNLCGWDKSVKFSSAEAFLEAVRHWRLNTQIVNPDYPKAGQLPKFEVKKSEELWSDL